MQRRVVVSGLAFGTAALFALAGKKLMAAEKRYKLAASDIRPLATGKGGCIASDRITVEGLPVRFMYREQPQNPQDSGWAFLSGTEDDVYMADAANHQIFDINTIANYDPSIIAFLDAPVGSAFEKVPGATDFVLVTDWAPTRD